MWELFPFYDSDDGSSPGHPQVWPRVLAFLALKWRKEEAKILRKLENAPYALPRGRVARMANRQFGIAHGNDAPVAEAITTIKRAYNLTGLTVKAYEDEHEKMLLGDPELLQQLLAVDLGLKGTVPPELQDDEEQG
jgi:hypothetical protein